MRKLLPKEIRILKVFHLIFAFMWLGGCMALTIFPFFVVPESHHEVLLYARVLDFIDIWMIIIGGVGSLLTGLVYSIWTNWGFFKHRWVTVKWVIVIVQTIYGTFVLGGWIRNVVRIAQNMTGTLAENPEYMENLFKHTVGALVQLVFLLFLVFVSVWKPWKNTARSARVKPDKLAMQPKA